MNKKFKKHLLDLERYRTSTGRDIENGLCLDRNEKVTKFTKKIMDEALSRITSSVLSCYPEPTELYKILSGILNIQKDQIYLTNGITEGIRVLFETLTNPGDEVIIVDPTYPMYRVYSDIYQTKYVPINFTDDLLLEHESIESKINDKTAFVCIANPNLPIESYLSLQIIRDIAEKCKKHDVLFVVDEAYVFLGGESAVSLIDDFDNLVVFQTMSKAFGLAGVRLGWMVSNKENIDYFSKTRALVESNGVTMAIAKYMIENIDISKEYVADLKQGLKYLREELTALGIKSFGGDYTNSTLLFMDNEEDANNALEYLRERKIYVRASFKEPFKNCLRVTLCPKESMVLFLDALKEWLDAK
ncbi:histidinol-phosphate aminotransferase family protein [Candidatus Pacearchaeota archaeon]|nr:histidinol-phosphate aminotransferase family protein [Candidatus Pacearchaeota archaeon]